MFDKKYKNIKNETKSIIDITKINKFKINIDLLSKNLDKIYNDIYAYLNGYLNSNLFIELENEFKINCQLNIPINKHEIMWKLLNDTNVNQFTPTKPILADYEQRYKEFNRNNPKFDPEYRDKEYVNYYKKYYHIDNLLVRKDPVLEVPNIKNGIQIEIYNTSNKNPKIIHTGEKNRENFLKNYENYDNNKNNLNNKFESIAKEDSNNNYSNVAKLNDNNYLIGNNIDINKMNNNINNYERLIENQKNH